MKLGLWLILVYKYLLIITNLPNKFTLHLIKQIYHQMLLIGKTGCGIYDKYVLSSQFFCKSKIVLKLNFYFKNPKERHIFLNLQFLN